MGIKINNQYTFGDLLPKEKNREITADGFLRCKIRALRAGVMEYDKSEL